MKISLVVAMTPEHVIGKAGGLPWRLPADLRHFRKITMGRPVVMGRKTYESIGKPLEGRTNIVLTRQEGFEAPGCLVARSPQEALRRALESAAEAPDEVMVIGGGSVYAAFLPLAQRMYVTLVQDRIGGDTWFPDCDFEEWLEVERVDLLPDAKNPHAYSFTVLERRPAARDV
ncbi:MAG: dihydrofolate reductase [Candidatus Krumholzibacteriia bacterium]